MAHTNRDQKPPRGTPIREYNPEFTEEDYAVIARILDEGRTRRAARRLKNGSAA